MAKSLLPDAVSHYINAVMSPETPVQKRLRAETAKLPDGEMLTDPDQAAALGFFVKLIGAQRAIEVGTFTGYSALAIAMALPDAGRLICCDQSEEWTNIGKPYWAEAKMADRIELRLGPALATLDAMLKDSAAGTIDFAFIDADKTGYDDYYERMLKLLRVGGLMIFDNMLRHGEVATDKTDSPGTNAVRILNLKARDDARVDASLLSIGDGFLLIRKR